MLTRHPVAALVASVVAAAGVTYVLASRRCGNRTGSPVPMVIGLNVSDAQTVIRSATGVSRIDVEQVAAPAPEGTVVTQTPVAGALVSRSVQIRLRVAGPEARPD